MSDIIHPDQSTTEIYEGRKHIEVVDSHGRPLMVMPSPAVHEQQLPSKSVFILLYNSEGKVYLQHRSDSKALAPGKWDISAATHVSAGEALESAAIRVLHKELNLTPSKLNYLQSQQAEISDATLWISIYTMNVGSSTFTPNPDEVQDGLFVDQEELASLFEHFPSMLTPILIWAIESDIIFKKAT